jgi:hypothetical protein
MSAVAAELPAPDDIAAELPAADVVETAVRDELRQRRASARVQTSVPILAERAARSRSRTAAPTDAACSAEAAASRRVPPGRRPGVWTGATCAAVREARLVAT